MKLEFKKLTPEAIEPTRAHQSDAGLDLYASEKVFILRLNQRSRKIPTKPRM